MNVFFSFVKGPRERHTGEHRELSHASLRETSAVNTQTFKYSSEWAINQLPAEIWCSHGRQTLSLSGVANGANLRSRPYTKVSDLDAWKPRGCSPA